MKQEVWISWVLGTSILFAVGTVRQAHAQSAPDVRDIRPIVMLLIDTSGSMERLPGCTCATAECDECYPSCGAASQRNRWAHVTEALTGTWNDFECQSEARTSASYVGAYDYKYFIPHHRLPSALQNPDGILDVYRSQVKFGLMTFDGIGTLLDESPLVEPSRFLSAGFLADSTTGPGMWSYGEPKEFTFPGCATSYMIDSGARGAAAPEGGLVSVGQEGIIDYTLVNQDVQDGILSARPFGATPIAAILDDARYYFDNHPDVQPQPDSSSPGDPMYACRSRVAVLLTDGYPNADMRGDPYNCDTPGYTCPYERPEEIASDLCRYNGSLAACDGKLDGLYVVGFDIADDDVKSRLNDLARVGGTQEAFFAASQGELMSKLASIMDATAPATTTRTVPAFVTVGGIDALQQQLEFTTGFRPGTAGTPWSGVLERRRIQCNGLLEPESQQISDDENDRFQEVLNARSRPRRLLTVIPRDSSNAAAHLVGEDTGIAPLGSSAGGGRGGGSNGGAGGAPAACTVSSGGSGGSGGGGRGSGGGSGGSGGGGGNPNTLPTPAETGLSLEAFSRSNARLDGDLLQVATRVERDEIIDWVHGETGTPRRDRRLGDIYHSSPVVVGPPRDDIPDESYNRFRELPAVANRPTVVYVGSNDGIMHAFATHDTTITEGPHAGTTLTAGEELWGFIPPMLLPRLRSTLSSHQWMADGTPVVKDVFYKRLPGDPADGSIYHTILVFGLRGGGPAYLALDVTDPLDPKFLWQFTNDGMGATYGTAGIGQVLVDAGGALQERGFALLPGGVGDDLTSTDSTGSCGAPVVEDDGHLSKPLGCPSQGIGRPPVTEGTLTARENQRCWGARGRQMYFVDLATGELVNQFDDRAFNAPLSGGISFFTGEVGTIATRAFITDQDGVLWRIDMSSPRMAEWDIAPFHDIFHDADAVDGQPAYFAPILTTDTEGQLVVIQGTGNIDVLDDTSANRVVSLTEKLTFDSTGRVTNVSASLNWEIRLEAGEQVTGPIELFDSKVYFASFLSSTDPGNLCALGEGRLWGVDFRKADGQRFPEAGLESTPGSGVFDRHFVGPFSNQVIMGASITQRPNCFEGVQETSPYVGSRFRVVNAGGGGFELVANVSGNSSRSGGGSVGQVSQQIAPPLQYTRAHAIASSID